MANSQSSLEPRPTCYRCFRPVASCLCGTLGRVDNRTGITVIQHPRERRHPFGTLRLVALGLADVHVLIDTLRSVRRSARPGHLPLNTGLLYPSPRATALEELSPEQRPEHLVVLDGTWHQAKTLFRDTAWLEAMPHFRLSPKSPSRYRIRLEPEDTYLSTVESIVLALELLEPGTTGLADLLDSFEHMIDGQIARAQIGGSSPRHRRTRPSRERPLPRALLGCSSDLVVVYAESTGVSAKRFDRELIYFAAIRVESGECFERLVLPRAFLNERHLSMMGLGIDERRGMSPPISAPAFRAEWQRFAKSSDIFVAWTESALSWLGETKSRGREVVLKAVYGRLGRYRGALESIAEQEGLVPRPVPLRGRARTRVGNAIALTELLRRHAFGK